MRSVNVLGYSHLGSQWKYVNLLFDHRAIQTLVLLTFRINVQPSSRCEVMGGDIRRGFGGFLGLFFAHEVINVGCGVFGRQEGIGQSISNSVWRGDFA